MIEYLTSTFIIRYSLFDILHPIYFAEIFYQSNQTKLIAYLSASGDMPRPNRMQNSYFFSVRCMISSTIFTVLSAAAWTSPSSYPVKINWLRCLRASTKPAI